jgi:23S rRNA pseudouridine2457 synthase
LRDFLFLLTLDSAPNLLTYYIAYKPFQTLCQFSASPGKKNLKDYFPLHEDIYPVGRLDYDSEGLLLLTNDPLINHRLLNPSNRHEREYWVQVEGVIDHSNLQELQSGVRISIDGKPYLTQRCKATRLSNDIAVPERIPPIRFRKHIPTSWISLVLSEGKNRQVRRMTASIGFPTLRLIRVRIVKLTMDAMQPGDLMEISRNKIYRLLFDEKVND